MKISEAPPAVHAPHAPLTDYYRTEQDRLLEQRLPLTAAIYLAMIAVAS